MIGAIEFLRKIKAIKDPDDKGKFIEAIIFNLHGVGITDEADLVRKVMAYEIKEGLDAERN